MKECSAERIIPSLAILKELLLLQVRTVGHVPAGLPPLTVRWWLPPEEKLADLLLVAAPLALVGLMESIAVGNALAAAAHDDIAANQELVGGLLV